MKIILLSSVIFLCLQSSAFGQQDSVSVQELHQIESKIDSLIQSQSALAENYSQLRVEIDSLSNNYSEQFDAIKESYENIENDYSSLTESLTEVSERTTNQQASLEQLQQNLATIESFSNELENEIVANREQLQNRASELGNRINRTEQEANEQFAVLDREISQNTVYWIIAVSITLIIALFLFYMLRRKVKVENSSLMDKISSTKHELEEEALKLDQKLVNLLNSQLKLMDENQSSKSTEGEEDHSLALKIADEITRIRMNLNHMDSSVKGWKQLDRSARAILNNFKSNGYELPELLGKDYDENMNVIATSEIDDSLEPGEQKIKRIIKPQVNYDGKMIQPAKIVIGIGTE